MDMAKEMNVAAPLVEKQVKKFGIMDKLGYMFGDLGNDFFFGFISSYLMVFYTDALGISAGFVGLIFVIARVWDAFADVMVGRFVDSRPATKNGKFKPWILRFAPMLVIAGALVFTKIPGMSNQFYLIYGTATYIIWGTLYSTVNIPYGSMASVISGNSVDRASLSTFRTIGATISGVFTGILAPMLIFVNNKVDSGRFFIVAVGFAILAMACYVLCYKMTTERIIVKETVAGQKGDFAKTLKAVAKNRPLIANLVNSLVTIFAMIIGGTLNVYLFKDYFHSASSLSIIGFMGMLNIVLVAPFMAPLIRKFGKKEVAAAGVLVSAIIYFILFLLPITNVYIYLGFVLIATIASGFASFTAWAIITDTIDYHEYLTGKREDGTLYSITSFTRKIGQAVAGGAGGMALVWVGYVAGAPQQTAEVAQNIKNMATLTPAIANLLAFLIIGFWYPLSKKKVDQLAIELATKREEKAKAE